MNETIESGFLERPFVRMGVAHNASDEDNRANRTAICQGEKRIMQMRRQYLAVIFIGDFHVN